MQKTKALLCAVAITGMSAAVASLPDARLEASAICCAFPDDCPLGWSCVVGGDMCGPSLPGSCILIPPGDPNGTSDTTRE